MIRKIILENYMSHLRTVIEPAAGLTILIGPNNCGKSAIAHALEMICYNPPGTDYAIRHGTKQATVTVETVDEDGTTHSLIWYRKKGTAGYIIDGRKITGAGELPRDLHDFLKMPEIRPVVGDPFRLHTGLQKKPIFLLDEPPSRAAHFFASASDADRLMNMQRLHKQKETNAKRDKEKLDLEIARLDQQLSDLSPLEEISQRLGTLEAQHGEIVAMDNQLLKLSRSIEAIEQAARSEQLYQMRAKSLESLQPLPKQHPLQALIGKIESISTTQHRAVTNRARLAALADLKSTPKLLETLALAKLVADLANGRRRFEVESNRVRITRPLRILPQFGDVLPLGEMIRKLKRLTADATRQKSQSAAFSELRQVPKQQDPSQLRKQIDELALAIDKLRTLEERQRSLVNLPPVPREIETKPISDLVAQVGKATATSTAAYRALQQSQKDVTDLAKQIELWVQANPKCQSCGQSISAELVIAGGHDHE